MFKGGLPHLNQLGMLETLISLQNYSSSSTFALWEEIEKNAPIFLKNGISNFSFFMFQLYSLHIHDSNDASPMSVPHLLLCQGRCKYEHFQRVKILNVFSLTV